MKNRVLKYSTVVVLIVVATISFYFVFRGKILKEPKEMILDFKDRRDDLLNLDEDKTQKYGWLQVQGTNVDVPILTKSSASEEYSFGWITSTSIGMKTRRVLIGHNVLNVSSSPMVNNPMLTDFEDLMSFSYYNFAKENMYVSFLEYGEENIYVIYAIGFYNYGYDSAQGLNTEKEIKEYIEKVKKNSIYEYGVDVDQNDDIITIKTCTRYFGSDEKQQFVIDARKLRKDEMPLKYSVKKTKLYKEYQLVDSYKKNDEI